MRAGRALRQGWALDKAAAELCRCGHACRDHRERGYGNPGHEAGRFYCGNPACDCTRYERGKS